MKLRNGFVSNSSSSSFICSISNNKDSWTDDMVKIDFLDDMIYDAKKSGYEDDYQKYTEEKNNWITYAKDNNVILFDLFFNEMSGDTIIEELERKIPTFKKIKDVEL